MSPQNKAKYKPSKDRWATQQVIADQLGPTLVSAPLLKALKAFATAHLAAISQGFPEGLPYTADHASAALLHQVNYDLEVLTRVAYQRCNIQPPMATTLQRGAFLAEAALAPAYMWLTQVASVQIATNKVRSLGNIAPLQPPPQQKELSCELQEYIKSAQKLADRVLPSSIDNFFEEFKLAGWKDWTDWLVSQPEAIRNALELVTNPTDFAKATLTRSSMPVAIAYFQKSLSIRVIPYANVALIGLPYSCITNLAQGQDSAFVVDYLAIPHEVGHYVYWHGRDPANPSQSIRRQLEDTVKGIADTAIQATKGDEAKEAKKNKYEKYKQWVEEIFADVYGCLVAGPAIAKSFEDMALEYPAKEFVYDDGIHPPPAVRPLIYYWVLAQINLGNNHTPQAKNDWGEQQVKQHLASKNEEAEDKVPAEAIGIKAPTTEDNASWDLDEDLQKIVAAIYGLLKDWPWGTRWTNFENAPDDVTNKGFYNQFQAFLTEKEAAALSDQYLWPKLDHAPITWEAWMAVSFAAAPTDETGWHDYHFAHGWSEEGPISQPGGG